MNTLEALANFMVDLGAAERKVDDLKHAMAAQLVCEGRVTLVTVREHEKAQVKLAELVNQLKAA